jgi:hypothetical protein
VAKDEAKWAYWEKQIKDWRSSGLSRNAYCKREGLKPTTFDYWRPLIVSDHAEAKAVTPPVSGNDITLVPVALAFGHPVGQPLKLKSPSGWEMNLPASIEPNWLIAILRQLP